MTMPVKENSNALEGEIMALIEDTPLDSIVRAAVGELLVLMARLISGNRTTAEIEWFLNLDSDILEMLMVQQFELTPASKAIKPVFSIPVSKIFAITSGIDLREVLKSASGTETTDKLHVDPNIGKIFGLIGNEVAPTQVTVLESYLLGTIDEQEIKNESRAGNLPTVQLLYLIASELYKVVNRNPSDFLSKDRWKLFFVGDLVIAVGWDHENRKWRVLVYPTNQHNTWFANCAVVLSLS